MVGVRHEEADSLLLRREPIPPTPTDTPWRRRARLSPCRVPKTRQYRWLGRWNPRKGGGGVGESLRAGAGGLFISIASFVNAFAGRRKRGEDIFRLHACRGKARAYLMAETVEALLLG